MKFTTCLTAACIALSSTCSATSPQSKPFYLKAISETKAVNNTYFSACQQGAEVQSLCMGTKAVRDATQFLFNHTATTPNPGVLTYSVPVSQNSTLSEPLTFLYDPSTNAVLPVFYPAPDDSGAQLVGFGPKNRMFVPDTLDDTKKNQTDGTTRRYFRWHICEIFYINNAKMLTWVAGEYPPQNPTCVKIEVLREFA